MIINILIAALNAGLIHMGRGRGISDNKGITYLFSKQIAFIFISSIIYLATNSIIPAVAFYIGMTTFWIKTGKLINNVDLVPRYMDEPGIKLFDYFSNKYGKNYNSKLLIYSCLYTLLFTSGFVVLSIFSDHTIKSYLYIFVGWLLTFLWPFVVKPVTYFKHEWKAWASIEFIIAFYFCFIICIVWLLSGETTWSHF
jgi:hypothetical protein